MYQHLQLIQRAKELGISVNDVSQIMDQPFTVLTFNGLSELVRDGVPTSWINVRSQFYCDNKQLTKLAYEELGIPYPKSVMFKVPDEPTLERFFKKGQKYVCKPLDGTNGVGVMMGIQNLKGVQSYFEGNRQLGTLFIMEEQVSGQDLRIQVLGGEIVAACIRVPAFVIGNGKDNLETLIENRRRLMKTQNPNNFLEIDESTLSLIKQQGLGLIDKPKKNKKIQLKHVSNMAQGAIATDVTGDIHPIYEDWVSKLVDYLKAPYFGVDIITPDFTKDPYENAWVLEINARADWLHHTFSERKTHDMAGMILKTIFGNG